METIILYTFGFILIAMVLMMFIPNDKIKEMADFFKKVLSLIPLADIVKSFRRNEDA
jgi:hypothetical protein